MKFILGGETGWEYFERMAYDGVIGLFYKTTFDGMIAHLIFALLIIFAIIGVLATLKWLFFGRRKKKKDAGKEWLKTGKF